MKKRLVCSLVMIFLLMFWTGAASAELITIGTATYTSAPNASGNTSFSDTANVYKLIYNADSPFGPITWLDYSNSQAIWSSQDAWAAGLDSALTINLNPGVSVAWGNNPWRLPSTVGGQYVYGTDGTTTAGYNITTSEMGHLFYTELGNKGYRDTDGNIQSDYSLKNTEDFNNLVADLYWSGTEYVEGPTNLDGQENAWAFSMSLGNQDAAWKNLDFYGLAVRSGQISVIPEPTTILLFGVGLLGIAGVSRRRKQ